MIISPIPGPSAVSALVSIAGIGADNYIFGGFFPKKEGQALAMLKNMGVLSIPIVYFESPKRIKKTLTLLNNYYKDAYCVVGKELTKCYESILYGNPSQILDTLTDDILKGEWCFIVSLPKEKKEFNTAFIKQACELGLTQNQIGTLAKTLGWNKKEVYNYVLNYKQD